MVTADLDSPFHGLIKVSLDPLVRVIQFVDNTMMKDCLGELLLPSQHHYIGIALCRVRNVAPNTVGVQYYMYCHTRYHSDVDIGSDLVPPNAVRTCALF